jgi:GT2 family glycosyltransferase
VGAAARNIGVALAGTPYAAMCDDDTWWAPGAIARAVAYLREDPRIDIVAAHGVVDPDGETDEASELMARSPLPPLPGMTCRPVLGFLAGACLIRTSTFWTVGGFNPRLHIDAEEHLMALDVSSRGGTVAYAPDVIVWHAPRPRTDQARRDIVRQRNELWCAWIRYPRRAAISTTIALCVRACADAGARSALRTAVLGLPWVKAERRPVPARVYQMVVSCEQQRMALHGNASATALAGAQR